MTTAISVIRAVVFLSQREIFRHVPILLLAFLWIIWAIGVLYILCVHLPLSSVLHCHHLCMHPDSQSKPVDREGEGGGKRENPWKCWEIKPHYCFWTCYAIGLRLTGKNRSWKARSSSLGRNVLGKEEIIKLCYLHPLLHRMAAISKGHLCAMKTSLYIFFDDCIAWWQAKVSHTVSEPATENARTKLGAFHSQPAAPPLSYKCFSNYKN